jgi:hypothetical protein
VINGESIRLEVIPDNIGCDSKGLNNNPSLAEKKIPESLEDVFPVLVACQIIVANVEIQEFEGLKQTING